MATMKVLQSASLVLLGLSSLVLIKMAGACSCSFTPYQTLYCQADIVIKGTIETKEYRYAEAALTNNEVLGSSQDLDSYSQVVTAAHRSQYPLYVVYDVVLNGVFKGEELLVGKKTITVSSSAMDSLCGVDYLQEGETYVISGFYWDGELNIGLCSSWVERYSSLTSLQKRGLKRLYAQTCDDCKVCSPQRDTTCESTQGCWQERELNYCRERNTLCTRKTNGKCAWKRNKYLKMC